MKRTLSLILILALCAALAACGNGGTATSGSPGNTPANTTTPGASGSPGAAESSAPPQLTPQEEEMAKGPVNLIMYMPGTPEPEQQLIEDYINEILKARINATIEMRNLDWSDYEARYPLLAASGEVFDLIYTSSWCFYEEIAEKGGYVELTQEIRETWLPNAMAQLPQSAWIDAITSGGVYLTPANGALVNPMGYVVRGDLMKKYGMSAITSLDDFYAYLYKVAENETGLIPYNAGGSDLDLWRYDQTDSSMTVRGYSFRSSKNPMTVGRLDSDETMYWRWDDPVMLSFLEKSKAGYDAGLWSKSVLSNQTTSLDAFVAGTSAATFQNLTTFNSRVYEPSVSRDPACDPQWFAVKGGGAGPVERSRYTSDGMAVSITSKNPYRAMMFLDLCYESREVANTFMFGIEGKHWALDSNGMRVVPDGVDGSTLGYNVESTAIGWFCNSIVHDRPTESDWPKYGETVARLTATAYTLPGMSQNVEGWEGELSAMQQAYDELIKTANWGASSFSPQETLDEWKKICLGLKAEEILADGNRQIDEFRIANGLK